VVEVHSPFLTFERGDSLDYFSKAQLRSDALSLELYGIAGAIAVKCADSTSRCVAIYIAKGEPNVNVNSHDRRGKQYLQAMISKSKIRLK
jgi:hypothetical protein